MKADLLLNFSLKGRWIGLGMICAPLLFDIVWMGVRGFMEYNMGVWGTSCQILGMVISGSAILIDRNIR